MKITTVIPSHGLRSTLADAVNSACEADEVFVLDTVGDAHASAVRDVCAIIRAPDRGMSGNWNQCFGGGAGEWLHILHDDDVVLPGFYNSVRCAPADRVVACAAGYTNVDAATGRTPFRQQYTAVLGHTVAGIGAPLQIGSGHLLGWLTRGNPFRPSSVVMRRDVARDHPFPDVGANDWLMWLRLASIGDWWINPSIMARMLDGAENDGNRIGAVARSEAVLATIEAAEAWLPRPHHMLMARDQYAKIAAQEGAHEVADRLAMRGVKK